MDKINQGFPSVEQPIPEYLLENARNLRKNQTDAETALWQLLRNRQLLGAKFRRQHTQGRYILDFYCHERKLAIELDGSQHLTEEGKVYDQERTRYLNAIGIEVMRFRNNEVLNNREGVMTVIYQYLLESTGTSLALTPALSRREREN